MNILTSKWPFVINAVLLGFLVVLGLYLFHQELSILGAVNTLSAYSTEVAEHGNTAAAPELSWEMALLGGVFIGAIAAALLGNSWKATFLFEEESSLGAGSLRTLGIGLCGGFLVMLGSLLAGETPAGQFAAAIELAPGAWLYLITGGAVASIAGLILERRSEGSGSGKSSGKKGSEG